jgi:hypothetical protein
MFLSWRSGWGTAPKRICRIGLAVLALQLGCDDYETTRDLEFGYFIHPGWLDAGSPGVVRAGVYVGPTGCWHLGGAALVRRGDRLVMSGYASGEGWICTTVLVFAQLQLDLPALERGRYVLQAGDLVDTLHVGSPAPRPGGKHFAAHGRLASGDASCTLFAAEPGYPGATEISGVVPLPPPIPTPPQLPADVILVGSVAGTDTCAGTEYPRLLVRGISASEPSVRR